MLEHIGELNEMLAPLAGSLSPEEQRILGITQDEEPDRRLRADVARTLEEDAMASSQQHVPQVRMQDRRDLRPWQGKESDGELMFNFENPVDAQDLYDFIIESGLCLPGEIRLHLSGHQHSVHFASSVLVQKPDVIQMAMIAYEDQLDAEDEEAFESLAEDVTEVLVERAALAKRAARKPSLRGSAEPKKTGRSVDFNPFHDKAGVFTSRDGLSDGGSWSDGKKVRLKATKKGAKLHFAGTKRPCGREARGKGKDMRCWDGKPGLGFPVAQTMIKSIGDKKRSGDRPMPSRKKQEEILRNLPVIRECLALYGIDVGDRESLTMDHFMEMASSALEDRG